MIWLCNHKKAKSIAELRSGTKTGLICMKCYLDNSIQWPEYIIVPYSPGGKKSIVKKFRDFHEREK